MQFILVPVWERDMQSGHHAGITLAERAVIVEIVKNGTVSGAARAADRPVATFRAHVRSIHSKTGTHSIPALVVWALEHTPCCLADTTCGTDGHAV
jgi:DNA-binding CsgD family transcriptional regulator